MTNQDCPIIPHTRQVLDTSQQLRQDMRKLRQAMKVCKDCPAGDECSTLRSFEQDFKRALYQVTREWGFDVVGEYEY